MIPGEVFPAAGDILLNEGAPVTVLMVANTGDRPVQVGSHYHFFEVNPRLALDREAAYGRHLDVQVDPVQQRAGNTSQIGGNFPGRGTAFVRHLAIRGWVHGGDQLKTGNEFTFTR